jgi:hypothetical protein
VSGDVASLQSAPRDAVSVGQSPAASAPSAQEANPAAVTAASKRPLTNPSLHLDLALNLVVLQFVDDNGDVTNSIPSAKQLKAYQENEGGSAAAVGKPEGKR